MEKIIEAYRVGEGVQIHKELEPKTIKVEYYEPGDPGFTYALSLIGMPLDKPTEYNDEGQLLTEARTAAWVEVDDLAMALGPAEVGGIGKLTEDEVVALSGGELPEWLVSDLGPKDRLRARMEAKKPMTQRTGALALAIQTAAKLNDEQMDALFNVNEE